MSQQFYTFLFIVKYGDAIKPTGNISDARWCAIVNHIRREYLK